MAGGPIWTRDEEEFLAQLKVRNTTHAEIYERYVARFGSVRNFPAVDAAISKRPWIVNRVKELQSGFKLPPLDPIKEPEPDDPSEAPTVVTRTPWDPNAGEKRWRRAVAATDEALQYHKDRHYARVEFLTTKPIGIGFISDQHISTDGPVDLARMESDALLFRDTPGLWAALGGDGVNNHIKHRAAMVAANSRPGDEWNLFDHYLSMFGHKIAAMVSGNHDDWTKDETDVDMVGRLAQKHRIFYAPDFVVLEIVLIHPDTGHEQAYKIKVRHQYRFGSQLNQGHTVKRMWEMDADDFDIGVVGHHHTAHFEPFDKHGLPRLAFRPGSYQYTSGHSRRYGFPPSRPTCPTAILLPDRRWMIPFEDARQAAGYLTYMRGAWPEAGTVFGDAA